MCIINTVFHPLYEARLLDAEVKCFDDITPCADITGFKCNRHIFIISNDEKNRLLNTSLKGV